MKGTVKFYNSTKGFGFIKVDGRKDVFFHKSDIYKKDYVPDEEDYVEFNLIHSDRGDKAEAVTKI